MHSKDTPTNIARAMTMVDSDESALKVVRRLGEAMAIPLITVIDNLSSLTSLVGYSGAQPLFSDNLPRKFREIYNRRHYRLNNPVYLACRSESAPFVWYSDDRPWSIPVTFDAAQKRTLAYARKFRLTGGLCIPIHAPRGHVGCINFIDQTGRDLEDLLDRWRVTLVVMGVFFMRIHSPPFSEDAIRGLRHLTKQEIACVRLSARGMTDKQIAIELNVVPGTARFHIENAAKKLGARSRTQTVAIAAQLGLIGPIA